MKLLSICVAVAAAFSLLAGIIKGGGLLGFAADASLLSIGGVGFILAVATFRSRKTRPGLVVPGTAVMRLHDKDWIFRHEGNNRYRRVEVQVSGATQDGMQEVSSGVKPDDELVLNALDFSTAVAEKKE